MAKYYGEESYFNNDVTFYRNVNIRGNLNFDFSTDLTVSGKSTLGVTTTTSLSAQNLSVSGVSTLGTVQISSGIVTATSGITTYYGDGSNLQINGTSLSDAISSSVPAGTIISYASTIAPTGYLKCNGAAISRTSYNSLFSGIGTIFGNGDGTTTFNVPDLRGEFIRGWVDDKVGIDTQTTFGRSQGDSFRSHTHTYNRNNNQNTDHSGTDTVSNNPSFTSAPTGSTGGDETRPRNISFLYCIKY